LVFVVETNGLYSLDKKNKTVVDDDS